MKDQNEVFMQKLFFILCSVIALSSPLSALTNPPKLASERALETAKNAKFFQKKPKEFLAKRHGSLHFTAIVTHNNHWSVRLSWDPDTSLHAKKLKLFRGKKRIATRYGSGAHTVINHKKKHNKTYTYRLFAYDSHWNEIKSKTLKVRVVLSCVPPTSTTISNHSYGKSVSVTLDISPFFHSASTLTYSATGLPPGLSIDSSTGVISGTTNTTVADYSVTVTGTNSCGSTSQTFTISVTGL